MLLLLCRVHAIVFLLSVNLLNRRPLPVAYLRTSRFKQDASQVTNLVVVVVAVVVFVVVGVVVAVVSVFVVVVVSLHIGDRVITSNMAWPFRSTTQQILIRTTNRKIIKTKKTKAMGQLENKGLP
jgi:type III secretory pathway component EscT